MGSVTSEFGGRIGVSYFSDDLPASNAIRLTAVAVWRTTSASRPRGWRDLLRRLRYHFGPFGLGFHLRHNVWSGSAGEHGEQETLYNRERRVVRVLGRDYALPADGRTLVLLIDEGGGAGTAANVTVRTVVAPVLPRPSIDGSPDDPTVAQQLSDAYAEQQKAWADALRSDPEVRAFMAESGASP